MSRVLKQLLQSESANQSTDQKKKVDLKLVPPVEVELKVEKKSPASRIFLLILGVFVIALLIIRITKQRASPTPTAEVDKLAPTQIGLNQEDVLLNQNAIKLFQSENYPLAKTSFETLLKKHPESSSILINLGMTHFRMNEFSKAKKYLLEAIKYNPNNVIALNDIGMLCYRSKNYQEALSYFHKAIVLNPNFSDSLLNLGETYEKIGEPLSAIKQYEAYIAQPTGDSLIKKILLKRITKLQSISRYFEKKPNQKGD